MPTPRKQTVMGKAEAVLKTRLGTDAGMVALIGTRLFKDVAPVKTPFPLCIYNYVSGTYDRWVGGNPLLSSLVYNVRAVARIPDTTADLADEVAQTAKDLLENYSSGSVLLMESIAPISRHYTIEGVTYEERGFSVHILVQGG